MSWRDRMETASFRGFEFYTDSHTAKGGRNTVQHVYVGGEVSDSEDTGKKPLAYQINAYVIGVDYDIRRDQFLAILNQTEPDWLVHPWLGRVWVRSGEFTLEETNDKGGYCTITVEFIPAREEPATTNEDVIDVAEASIGDFMDVAEAEFDLLKMSSEGLTAFIATCQQKLEVLREIISMTQLPLTAINAITGMINGAILDIKVLIDVPGNYASALRGIYTSVVSGAQGILKHDKPNVITRLTNNVGNPPPAVTGTAAFEFAVRENLQRETDLQDRLIVAAVADIAIDDYQVAEDRDAVLNTVNNAIETLLPGMSDDVFQAAVMMQAAVDKALQSQDLSPAVIMTIAKPLPAAVLAHRLEVDEETFIARNRVRHPLFVIGRIYG